MRMDDLNTEKYLAAFLYNSKTPNDKLLLKRKFRYMEAVVRFLNLYCQNELGSGEVDIEKVVLWTNSPYFENLMARSCRSTDAIYRELEKDILADVPLYRLLNISDHLLNILEANHKENLQARMLADAKKNPCQKCIWFNIFACAIGTSASCNRPNGNSFGRGGDGYFEYKRVKSCRFCTTTKTIPDTVQKYLNSSDTYYAKKVQETIEENRAKWQDKYDNLDNSVIPREFAKLDLKRLRELSGDGFSELYRVFGGKQTFAALADNLQEGFLVKAMIEFVEIYAQTELGSDYTADIAKIAEFAFRNKRKRTMVFDSEEDVYAWLEEQMVQEKLNVSAFCTRKDF